MPKQVHKQELVSLVHDRLRGVVTLKDCQQVINTVVDAIGEILEDTDKDLVLPNLGVFKTIRQASRDSHDFHGNPVSVPRYKRVVFKTSKNLKKRLILGE